MFIAIRVFVVAVYSWTSNPTPYPRDADIPLNTSLSSNLIKSTPPEIMAPPDAPIVTESFSKSYIVSASHIIPIDWFILAPTEPTYASLVTSRYEYWIPTFPLSSRT